MSDNYNLRAQVKDANREFHDLVADVYDQLGSREDTEFKTWLEDKIKKLKGLTRGECLLDLGCGRGFAEGCFIAHLMKKQYINNTVEDY